MLAVPSLPTVFLAPTLYLGLLISWSPSVLPLETLTLDLIKLPAPTRVCTHDQRGFHGPQDNVDPSDSPDPHTTLGSCDVPGYGSRLEPHTISDPCDVPGTRDAAGPLLSTEMCEAPDCQDNTRLCQVHGSQDYPGDQTTSCDVCMKTLCPASNSQPVRSCQEESNNILPNDIESQSPTNQPEAPCRPYSEHTSTSLENEQNLTPQRGPVTRSKTVCRQTQLTDSFSYVGGKSTSKQSKDTPVPNT